MDIKPIHNLSSPVNLSSAVNQGAAIDPGALHQSMQSSDPRVKAEAVASQLEKVFMGMMVKAMRATVPENDLGGKDLGGKNYVEMLDQQYSQLEGMPRDPRFHEVLVRQIMQTPEKTSEALGKMK